MRRRLAIARRRRYDRRRAATNDHRESALPQTLSDLLTQDGCLALPGVYDGVSAKLAASAGFEALYMTGYGVVASALGIPDAGIATYSEMLDRVRCIAAAARLGKAAPAQSDRHTRGVPAAGLHACCRPPPESDGGLQGLVAGGLSEFRPFTALFAVLTGRQLRDAGVGAPAEAEPRIAWRDSA